MGTGLPRSLASRKWHCKSGGLQRPEPDGDEEAREVEITDLSDRAGVRRFKNLDTGSIRVEGEAKPRRKSGKSED
jgi:hypothetical protein